MHRFRGSWTGHAVVFGLAIGVAFGQSSGRPFGDFGTFMGFVCAILSGEPVCPFDSGSSSISPRGNAPVVFEWNLGQTDSGHDFVARTFRGYSIQVSSLGATVEAAATGQRVRAKLAGSARKSAPEPEGLLPGRVNYILGSDPSRWITDIPTFERVRYRSAYPGIDVVWYGHGANVEYDFVVNPGADPGVIRMEFESAQPVATTSEGDLAVGGEVLWGKPVVYQNDKRGGRRAVEGRYKLLGGSSVGFELGAFDPSQPLVIDPEIRFASYLGGQRNDYGTRSAVDEAGNLYLTGATDDSLFPITPGAFVNPTRSNVEADVFIAKFRADGTGLVYSTFIGGLTQDTAGAIAVDAAGNVFLTGFTTSLEFPTTAGALRRQIVSDTVTGRFDCFVLKLNAAGNALVYSTLLGGRHVDACTGLAVDSAGNATVAGSTASNDFPVSASAFQANRRVGITDPGFDAFVARLNPGGTALLSSTFLGGNANDFAASLAVDAAGNSYVVGSTNSPASFPTTDGTVQPRYRQAGTVPDRNSYEGFLVKVNPTASSVVFGTYLGGAGRSDAVFGVAVDAQSNVYVCGNTDSTDFTVTSSVLQPTFRGAGGQLVAALVAGDAFAAKLNPTGTAFLYSTYLGGSRDDRALGCVLDSTGSLHLAGYTLSTDFPVTADAVQRTYGGTNTPNFSSGDAFYARLDAQGRALLFSTYYGGRGDDAALGIALGSDGSAYLSGSTGSPNLPLVAAAHQRILGGAVGDARGQLFGDAFTVKIGDKPAEAPAPAIASLVSSASGVGGGVAPGELVTVAVSNLRAAPAVSQARDRVFPTELSQVRVLFDDTPAAVLGISPGSIAVVAPFGLAGKTATQVVVEEQGAKSAALSVPVVAAKPGLFTVNPAGRGQARAINEDGSANSAETPAVAGSIFTLVLTGAGVTEPPSRDGFVPAEDDPPLAVPVTVAFGDTAAEEIFYSGGAAGQVAGVAKVSLRLPANLPAGDIPVTVTIGGVTSQSGVTVAVVEAPRPEASGRR